MSVTKIKGCAIMCLVAIFVFQNLYSQKPAWSGVWGIWGGHVYSNETYPWYTGTMIHTRWFDIEPQNNQFDFSGLDNVVQAAVNNGLYVGLHVYIAPDMAPEWLYTEAEVEEVITVDGKSHPWYYDPDFKREFKQMIQAFADHVDTYPPEIRNKIALIQVMVAKSGDPQPWNADPVDPKYHISQWWNDEEWRDYCREMFKYYYDAFVEKEPEILVMLKPVRNSEVWCRVNLPEAGRKAFSPGQGAHLGNEANYFYQYETIKDGVRGVREEFDVAIRDNTVWFNTARKWNIYSSSLWSLTYGMDIWNQRTQIMDDPDEHLEAFTFFTKYAGHNKNASKSSGAWVAFRDDLDGANLSRFPESIYGNYDGGKNPARNQAIALEFAEFGAKQDDPGSAFMDMLQVVKNQDGLNDVQSNIWRGNYNMYINQIDALNTSQGYWRVGSKVQPYGRFARGFHHEEGKDAIYLDIEDKFFDGNALNGSYPVNVNVIYFDSGTGSWEIRYDAIGDSNKLAMEVVNTNTGEWKQLTLQLNDANFANSGPLNSDISLINSDDQDNIFHMVEITRDIETGTANHKILVTEAKYCYPNPFDPKAQFVTIPLTNNTNSVKIYDMQGRMIRILLDEGNNKKRPAFIQWNGKNETGVKVAAGIYFFRVNDGNQMHINKILVL